MAVTVEQVPIDRLIPHPRNPRRGNVAAIMASIRLNGWIGVVVAQRSTGYVLAGNHRVQAARELGMDTVPTHWLDCDDAQALRVLLADNRTSDLGTYEMDDLDLLLRELAVGGVEQVEWPDVDAILESLAGTGFEFGMRGRMIGPASGDVVEPGAGPTGDGPAVSAGDYFAVQGRAAHRLIVGDARDGPPESSGDALVVSDPPYELPEVGKILACYGDRAAIMGAAKQIFNLAPWEVSTELVWVHGSRSIPAPHRPIYEHTSIVLAHLPGVSLGWSRPDPAFSSVLRFPAAGDHYAKPVALMVEIIRGFPAGPIVDPFAGQGSTLLAADYLGRPCLGIELDPAQASRCLAKLLAAGMTVEPG